MRILIPQGRAHPDPRAGRDHVRGKDQRLMAGQDHHVADLAHGQDQDVATVAEQNQDQSPVAVQDQSQDPDPGRIHQGVAKTQGPGPGLAAGDEAAGDQETVVVTASLQCPTEDAIWATETILKKVNAWVCLALASTQLREILERFMSDMARLPSVLSSMIIRLADQGDSLLSHLRTWKMLLRLKSAPME